MKKVVLLCAYVLFTVCANAQTIMGRQIVDQFPINSSGTLTYGLTWLPATYSSTTRTYPLIIFLHGAGETGTTVSSLSKLYTASPRSISGRIADGWDPVAVNPRTGVQDSFIVVSPQAPSWSYNYTDLKHILPSILKKYRVDRSRIYLTGLSAGGGGTFSTFGSRDSLFIKNFAAMATSSSAGTNASNGYTSLEVEEGLRYGSTFGVKMWTIAGEQDYLLNTDVRYHDSTNMLNPTTPNKLTVIQGVGHSAWGRMFDPAFRPNVNYYGKTGSCNNGCNNGGIQVAPNANGSSIRGSGITQDSLNLYEWLLLSQRTEQSFSPNIGDYRSNAPKSTGGKWSTTSSWRRFDGSNWVATAVLPSASAGAITIRNNDSIDVDVTVTTDQLIVETGAVLNLQAGGLIVSDGSSPTDLFVKGVLNLSGAASITGAGSALLNGSFNWSGGTLDINIISAIGAVTNVSGSTTKMMSANFTNNGTFVWSTAGAGGNILLTDARFINNGLLKEEFTSNKGFTSGGGAVDFVNNGTFQKMSANTFLNNSVSFTNTGTLQGIGAFNFSGTVSNTGIIKPGNSPGILSVSGGIVTGQNAQINIDIFDGSGAGTGHNRLDLTGDINLSGNNITITESPAAPNQSYVIMTTTGSFSGSFANANLPAGYTITYNQQTISVSKGQGTLPAVWGAFELATVNGKSIDLKWNTLQEENTSYFEIEHSKDGAVFTPIARIQAAGNSSLEITYRFTHHKPLLNAANYYRIKLVDLDGKISYSVVKLLKLKQGTSAVRMLANTVSDNLQIQTLTNNLQVTVIDMTGRVFCNKLLAGNGLQTLNTAALAKGMYKLVVHSNGRVLQTESFIKY